MKIAVLIYGQLRELPIGIKSWGFKNELDCDFYFSVWDKVKMESENLKIIEEYNITEDDILKYIPSAKIEIHDESKIFGKGTEHYPPKSHKVAYHMKNAFKMLELSGEKYDFIMLTRSDMFLHYNKWSEFLTFNKEKTIYAVRDFYMSPENKISVYDTFLYGSFDVMSNLIKNIPIDLMGMHIELAEIIMKCGYNVVGLTHKFGCITIRPNCRDLKGNELNQINVAKKMVEWGSNH